MEKLKNIERYLDGAVMSIRDKKKKRAVRDEISCHMYERYNDFLLEGYAEDKAEELTLKAMGDFYPISKQLGKNTFFFPER